jgi:protein O-mannosyl-transferase
MFASYGILIKTFSSYWKALVILSAATILVYSVSFSNGFVMDDEDLIVNNPQTLSLDNLTEVLLSPDFIKPYYRPLNRASYLIDYKIAGMKPAWYHGVNIFIHLGNVLLLYFLLCRFLPNKNTALITALIFAVHPVNTEAVNFVSARNTLLALFFSLSSLLSFICLKSRGKRWPIFSAMLFFCGLLSKETALMLIFLIPLSIMCMLPGQLTDRRPVKECMFTLSPYLLATGLYFIMRTYSLHGIIGVNVPTNGLLNRLAQNYHIIPQYFGLLLLPANLTFSHTVPQDGLFSPAWFFPAWLTLLAILVLIAISRDRVACFGLAWFIINYLPISNIVPIPSALIAERFLYMPSIGFFIAFNSFLSWSFARIRMNKVLWIVTWTIIIIFAMLSVRRNLEWKNDLILFSSDAKIDANSPAAHYNLGTALKEIGDLASAKHEWEQTLALAPDYADALTQMGTLAAIQGDLQMAQKYYESALKAPHGIADPNRALAHYNLGKIYEKWHRTQLAIEHYEKFLKNVPLNYIEYKPEVENRVMQLQMSKSLDHEK